MSLWIDQLKAGDREATQQLWGRYFQQMMELAQQKLASRPRLGANPEDVALSAFDSFFRGAEAGRFPQLNDRDDLWHLLVTITARKAQRLFDQLPEEDLRAIAVLKMEGHMIDEMSAKLGCSLATIERKLKVIRAVWEKDLAGT